MLVLVFAWCPHVAARVGEADSKTLAAGNATNQSAAENAIPEAAQPPTEDRNGKSSETTADAAAETSPLEAKQPAPDRGETRGAMPERESVPESAGKPAPKTQSEAPPMPGGDVGWSGYFQALGAIFLIIAVLAGGFFLLKRFGPRAMGGGVFGRGTLQLEAQLPLGPRRSVAVVRFLNKRLVLGVTDSNITLLTETETGHDDEVPEYISSAPSGGSAFSKMLAKARNPRT